MSYTPPKNQINPRKLLHSKWTAVEPMEREKHFLVTDVEFDEEGVVIHCELEAVISHNLYPINWRDLKDASRWKQGWQ